MATPAYDEEEWDDGPPDELLHSNVADITESEKADFLQLIRQGYDRREAAKILGYKARPWRSLTSPLSSFYDEAFTNAYFTALGSPDTKMQYVERLRERVRQFAFEGEVRLLEKEAMVHLPEWAVLRQKDVNVNVLAVFEQHLKELPTDLLKQVLDRLEAGDSLEDATAIEDAEILELPPPSDDVPPAGETDGNGDQP